MPGSNKYSTWFFDTEEIIPEQTPSTQPASNVQKSVQTPVQKTFDPNAGRQDAYDTRWKNYLAELGKSKNRININKAKKYFDSQFEQDWNNEATSRNVDFTLNQAKQKQNDIIGKFRAQREEAARLSQEQDALDYEAAGYTYDAATGKWNKPVTPVQPTPVQKPKTDWNAVAASKLGAGKTMNDVKALQNKMKGLGFNVGTIDGMWGDNTQKAYDLYQQYLNNPTTYDGYTHLGSNRGYHYYQGQDGKVYMGGANGIMNTPQDQVYLDPSIKSKIVKNNPQKESKESKGSSNWALDIAMADSPAAMIASGWRRNKDGEYIQDQQDDPGVTQLRDNLAALAGTTYGVTLSGLAGTGAGATQRLLTGPTQQSQYLLPGSTTQLYDKFGNLLMSYNKGGQINKHQQGGTMGNQEELQKAFMAFLIEDAAAQGMQIQSEQDLQAYAQQLGEEGLKAKYQEFMQKMQGGVKAALGAKLNYINKLKGNCPEGEELVYMKRGGRMCPVCQKKAEKAEDGKKLQKKNAVSDFKEKRKKINPNDTVNTKFGPRDLNGKTKYPKYDATKENYDYETRKRVQEKDEKSGKKVIGSACGSKMKKK